MMGLRSQLKNAIRSIDAAGGPNLHNSFKRRYAQHDRRLVFCEPFQDVELPSPSVGSRRACVHDLSSRATIDSLPERAGSCRQQHLQAFLDISEAARRMHEADQNELFERFCPSLQTVLRCMLVASSWGFVVQLHLAPKKIGPSCKAQIRPTFAPCLLGPALKH